MNFLVDEHDNWGVVKHIMIPLNENGFHWHLMVVEIKLKRILHVNSLNETSNTNEFHRWVSKMNSFVHSNFIVFYVYFTKKLCELSQLMCV